MNDPYHEHEDRELLKEHAAHPERFRRMDFHKRFPEFDMSAELRSLCAGALQRLHREWGQHVDRVFLSAILRECGEMPSLETMKEKGLVVISPTGAMSLTWGGIKNVIATVEPPKIYKPEMP